MPEHIEPLTFYVPVDEVRVHWVRVDAPDDVTAQALAEQAVEADRHSWYTHTAELVVGDAETKEEWALAPASQRLFARPPARSRAWRWLPWLR